MIFLATRFSRVRAGPIPASTESFSSRYCTQPHWTTGVFVRASSNVACACPVAAAIESFRRVLPNRPLRHTFWSSKRHPNHRSILTCDGLVAAVRYEHFIVECSVWCVISTTLTTSVNRMSDVAVLRQPQRAQYRIICYYYFL